MKSPKTQFQPQLSYNEEELYFMLPKVTGSNRGSTRKYVRTPIDQQLSAVRNKVGGLGSGANIALNKVGNGATTTDPNDMHAWDKWNEDFSHRPSWCDAGLALQLVKQDRADACKVALWLRSYFQRFLFWLGCLIQKRWPYVLLLVSIAFLGTFFGFRSIYIETNIEKLWVEKGGQLNQELDYVHDVKELKKQEVAATTSLSGDGSDSSYQVVIQTPLKGDGTDVLTKADLMAHAHMLTNVSRMQIQMFGANWTLTDFCFKPGAPEVKGEMGQMVGKLLDKIIPCIIITPLDCFFEGAIPLGPNPPFKVPGLFSSVVQGLPSMLSWKNLDPENILESVANMLSYFGDARDIVEFQRLFKRAGINHAYQIKPCLDPFDPECPKTSPNYRKNETLNYGEILNGGCDGLADKLMQWPEDLIVGGIERSTYKAPMQKAEALESVMLVSSAHDVYRRWIGAEKEGLDASKWSESNAQVVLDAWQRNFSNLVYNSPFNHDLKLRQEFFKKYNVNGPIKDRYVAPEAVYPPVSFDTFSFLRREYSAPPMFHPLAGTSLNDMMAEFSKFNPTVIIIGYVLMLIYSGLSLMNCRDRGIPSCTGLGVGGVLLVTYATLAGLGCSSLFGIQFNAATTNIVPFLTLGLGVDDMFLLVHNYIEITGVVHTNELGYLLKETGLSVLLTSINNILAFCCGGILPVPALRSFCWQIAITLFFNMVAILTIFPAMMAIDLLRRAHRRTDIFCCFEHKDKVQPKPVNKMHVETGQIGRLPKKDSGMVQLGAGDGVDSQPPPYHSLVLNPTNATSQTTLNGSALNVSGNTWSRDDKNKRLGNCTEVFGCEKALERFVENVYSPFLSRKIVKIVILTIFGILVVLGVIGVWRIEEGLELTDVVPSGTAPYDFLTAREKYFSFYTMNLAIGKGYDYPKGQTLLHKYREEIGNIDYVVKDQGSIGQTYWLALFRDWVTDIQNSFDDAWKKGQITEKGFECDDESFVASNSAILGYKLMINAGDMVDKSRIGKTLLVDKDGIINPQGFYNYLTAWYHKDDITYYLSQASLVPLPHPKWEYLPGKDCRNLTMAELTIPPAEPLLYSQFPFFLSGLSSTPEIVDMIRQVRDICDEYKDKYGIPTFPEGIPFTFWEQYLNLKRNLLISIGSIIGCVMLVITLLLMAPRTACIVVFCILMMIVELGGFMGLIGLKLNPVSAVTLITAVGIGVEFTVHLSFSYLTALGDRNERMALTLDHMFVPVLHGGLSTLLGIIMLAFSEFQFIVRYFFVVMMALVILGLLNGLILLPVLLSVIGPRPEVRPKGGMKYLPPPTPPMNKRLGRSDDEEGGGGTPRRRAGGAASPTGNNRQMNTGSGGGPYNSAELCSIPTTISEESYPTGTNNNNNNNNNGRRSPSVKVVVHGGQEPRRYSEKGSLPYNGALPNEVDSENPVTVTARAEVQVQVHNAEQNRSHGQLPQGEQSNRSSSGSLGMKWRPGSHAGGTSGGGGRRDSTASSVGSSHGSVSGSGRKRHSSAAALSPVGAAIASSVSGGSGRRQPLSSMLHRPHHHLRDSGPHGSSNSYQELNNDEELDEVGNPLHGRGSGAEEDYDSERTNSTTVPISPSEPTPFYQSLPRHQRYSGGPAVNLVYHPNS